MYSFVVNKKQGALPIGALPLDGLKIRNQTALRVVIPAKHELNI